MRESIPSLPNLRATHQAYDPKARMIPKELLPRIRIPQLGLLVPQLHQSLTLKVQFHVLPTVLHELPDLLVKGLDRVTPEAPSGLTESAEILIGDLLL